MVAATCWLCISGCVCLCLCFVLISQNLSRVPTSLTPMKIELKILYPTNRKRKNLIISWDATGKPTRQ